MIRRRSVRADKKLTAFMEFMVLESAIRSLDQDGLPRGLGEEHGRFRRPLRSSYGAQGFREELGSQLARRGRILRTSGSIARPKPLGRYVGEAAKFCLKDWSVASLPVPD